MISIKQSPSRIKKIIGYNAVTRHIYTLPIECVRKPVTSFPTCPYFCFVSNPYLIHTKNIRPFMWLHCYKDDSVLPTSAPKYLFPESDCVDQSHCPVNNRDRTIYDYAYFTISGAKSGNYKGLDNFICDVSTLDSLGLHGIVVFYNGTRQLSPEYNKYLRKRNIAIHDGLLSRHNVVKIMSKSKFGFFPNKFDCSPRMIPEFFLQNRPVIVNSMIDGGWHYLNDPGFGSLYTPTNADSLKMSVEHVLSLPRNQRSMWENTYGFEKGTRRLANLIKRHFPCEEINNSTHAYFKEYKEVFIQMPEMFK